MSQPDRVDAALKIVGDAGHNRGLAVDQLTTAATPLPIWRCMGVGRLLEQGSPARSLG